MKCKQCKRSFTPKHKEPCCSHECTKIFLSGNELYLKRIAARAKSEVRKAERKKNRDVRIEVFGSEIKKQLQREINKLSRMIDARFGFKTCIDCGKEFGKQTDGAHYHGTGSNSSLRYNLHNIHSARSSCNQYSDRHKEGYREGLEKRYGREYMIHVVEELPEIYRFVKLSNIELHEKLILTRKLIREFEGVNYSSSVDARDLMNKHIGIY